MSIGCARGVGRALCMTLLVWLMASEGLAATHDWVVQGVVLSRSGTNTTCLPSAVGSAFRLDYTFDDSVIGVPSPLVTYASITSWKLRIGSEPPVLTSPGTAGGGNGSVVVVNDTNLNASNPFFPPGLIDVYITQTSLVTPTAWTDCALAGTDATADLVFTDASGALFSSTAQPTAPFSLIGLTQTLGTLTLDGMNVQLGLGISTLDVAGSSQGTPLLPVSQLLLPNGTTRWTFGPFDCGGPCWADPPFTSGYVYESAGPELFTSIDDFPSGFASDFEVVVGGSSLGAFGPGDTVDFTGMAGGGTSSFTVQGISPTVDSKDDLAFPLSLSMQQPNSGFTMTSIKAATVPALPVSMSALLLSAILALGWVRFRRRT